MWWFIGHVVAHWICGGSLDMWWLIGHVVAHWICGGSLDMWWLIRHMVAHWRCGGSFGDVVNSGAEVPGSKPTMILVLCRIIV